MEKKMYNQPITEVAEIESMCVIMEGTVSGSAQQPTQDQNSGGVGDAPARYPQF